MSERFPEHKRFTIASMARDITLRHGQRIFNPDSDNTLVEVDWDKQDSEQRLWFVKLVSNSLYDDSFFTLDLRSATTDNSLRFTYDTVRNTFTYESPLGKVVDLDESITAQGMHDWLASHSTPESVTFDTKGLERQRQIEFEKVGARIAVNAVLETYPGRELLQQLALAQDAQQINELHEAFYTMTRGDGESIYVGRAATRQALEPLIRASRPRRFLVSE